jgi:hypothetical protein
MWGMWRDYYQKWEVMTRGRLDPVLLELVPSLKKLVPPARLFDSPPERESPSRPKLQQTRGIRAIPAKVRSGFASGIAQNKKIGRFRDSEKSGSALDVATAGNFWASRSLSKREDPNPVSHSPVPPRFWREQKPEARPASGFCFDSHAVPHGVNRPF